MVIYGGTDLQGRSRERGAVVNNIDEVAAFLATCNTYCYSKGTPLQLSDGCRTKIDNWLKFQNEKILTFRTTGCGAWECLMFATEFDSYDAYKAHRDELLQQKAHDREQKRLAELNLQRKGWYRVSLDCTYYGFRPSGNDSRLHLTFDGVTLASSGMDAYQKAVEEAKKVVEHHGIVVSLESYAEPTELGYSFEFLGVKTDDGYSVALWEQWQAEGKL
jgi:hypothetical protein